MTGHDDEMKRHNRRYMVFAVALAVAVLAISAVSITVVVTNTP